MDMRLKGQSPTQDLQLKQCSEHSTIIFEVFIAIIKLSYLFLTKKTPFLLVTQHSSLERHKKAIWGQ